MWGCLYGGTDLQISLALLVRQILEDSNILYRTSHPHGAAHGIRGQRAWRAETVPACVFGQADFQLRVRRKKAPHSQQSGVPSAGVCEHVIPGELAGNEADVHNTGEHLLPDKPTISFACGTSRLRIPVNRV